MPLKLQELISDSEFLGLARCEFEAFEDPVCKLMQLFFPIKDNAPGAREAAIEEAAQRQTRWHREDPTSRWIKVVDEESGRIAGAVLWHMYETDPYAEGEEVNCEWWDPGEGREVANHLMGQFLVPRHKYMRKPHAFLDMMFTHADFRRRGVGNLMMQWGVEQADAKGLESYVDATVVGRELYKTWDFFAAEPASLTLEGVSAGSQRKRLEDELLPFQWWPMHRPVGGKYEEGKGLLPWEKE